MPRAFGGQSQQRWGDNTLNKQEFMRDIQLIDTTGKVCSTSDARRKGMLVLAFFRSADSASEPVVEAMQRLSEAYKESGKLTVWGISEDDVEDSAAFARRTGITFPILLDRDAYHAMTYGITTFPTLFFADASGIIQRKIVGMSVEGMRDISAKAAAFAGVDPVDIFTLPAAQVPEGAALAGTAA